RPIPSFPGVEASAAAGATVSAASSNTGLPRAVIPPMNLGGSTGTATAAEFELSAAPLRPEAQRFQFDSGIGTLSEELAAPIVEQFSGAGSGAIRDVTQSVGAEPLASAESLGELKPLGQVN